MRPKPGLVTKTELAALGRLSIKKRNPRYLFYLPRAHLACATGGAPRVRGGRRSRGANEAANRRALLTAGTSKLKLRRRRRRRRRRARGGACTSGPFPPPSRRCRRQAHEREWRRQRGGQRARALDRRDFGAQRCGAVVVAALSSSLALAKAVIRAMWLQNGGTPPPRSAPPRAGAATSRAGGDSTSTKEGEATRATTAGWGDDFSLFAGKKASGFLHVLQAFWKVNRFIYVILY
jgi:hypothetical protein